jgi:hypothetical protein
MQFHDDPAATAKVRDIAFLPVIGTSGRKAAVRRDS